mgnify:CR=1 FL=1
MSRKQNKQQEIRRKATEKARKRKANKEERRKKSTYRKTLIESLQEENEFLRAEVNSLKAQLMEARSATSLVSNNTQHGSVRSAVLSDRTREVGFKKNTWRPPDEQDLEPDTEIEKQPPVAGFNKAAWTPPNGDTE